MGNYVIRAWAENDDGTRISPQASIELSVQQQASIPSTEFQGYEETEAGDDGNARNYFRAFGGSVDNDAGNGSVAVWGLSIQDK